MIMNNKPTVFVSSTCYDLKQIRNDLKHFLEYELGYSSLLSESDSFPVDPTISTVENCVRNVDERADLFVLIIGGRYGNITGSGQSVTNIEYLHARQKNIPIYVYIDKSILSNISLWKENPHGSFKSVVDTPKLFEFVESIRSLEGVWTFSYENANDIISSLRSQFAYLFSSSLRIRSLFCKAKLSINLRTLTGDALNIVITKPIAWEFRLFTSLLSDGIEEYANHRRDFSFGISNPNMRTMRHYDELSDYINCKLTQLEVFSDNLSVLFTEVKDLAFGAQGVTGDADLIVYTAKSIISIYGSFIDWSLGFRELITDPIQDRIIKSMARLIEPTLEDIENFVVDCKASVENILSIPPDSVQPITISNTLTLRSPDVEEFCKVIKDIFKDIGVEYNPQL